MTIGKTIGEIMQSTVLIRRHQRAAIPAECRPVSAHRHLFERTP